MFTRGYLLQFFSLHLFWSPLRHWPDWVWEVGSPCRPIRRPVSDMGPLGPWCEHQREQRLDILHSLVLLTCHQQTSNDGCIRKQLRKYPNGDGADGAHLGILLVFPRALASLRDQVLCHLSRNWSNWNLWKCDRVLGMEPGPICYEAKKTSGRDRRPGFLGIGSFPKIMVCFRLCSACFYDDNNDDNTIHLWIPPFMEKKQMHR